MDKTKAGLRSLQGLHNQSTNISKVLLSPPLLLIGIFIGGTGQMLQQVTAIYFDTLEKANRFVNSTEGDLFDDPYGDGQDNFEYTTYAGDPKLVSGIDIGL